VLKSGLLIIVLAVAGSVSAEEWKLSFHRDNIHVYVRPRSNSAYHEVRAEIEVSASLSTLLTLLQDVTHYPAWMENSKSAEYLPGGTLEEGYGYMVMTTPWPLAHRDVGYRYLAYQDSATLAVTIKVSDVPGLIPEKPPLVRIPHLESTWQLKPMGGGLVHIAYHVHLEVGGLVPAALVNAVLTNTPFKTLQRLREEIKKPRFRDAIIPTIVEP
jgi:hypothetical protein